jgi:TRAP-type mannitol/chloroaromatic compound transport system permease large subunit
MPPSIIAILILGLLFVLLAGGMPLGFAMGLSGFLGMLLLIDVDASLALLGQTAYETGLAYNLSVIPLFVLMGYIAGEAGLNQSLYRACNAWLGHRRGGLALATIGACGAFAAICGSSLATAATMAQIALPEMRKYKYDDRLATGAVAAGGTIGILRLSRVPA